MPDILKRLLPVAGVTAMLAIVWLAWPLFGAALFPSAPKPIVNAKSVPIVIKPSPDAVTSLAARVDGLDADIGRIAGRVTTLEALQPSPPSLAALPLPAVVAPPVASPAPPLAAPQPAAPPVRTPRPVRAAPVVPVILPVDVAVVPSAPAPTDAELAAERQRAAAALAVWRREQWAAQQLAASDQR